MSVAIPIPLLQHLPDVNVTLGVGVDEYALIYDHDTARFVLRAPFAGLLATGATVGATAQAQAFTLGVVSPFNAPAADGTTAWQVRKADKTTSVLNVDTTNARVGIGTTAPAYRIDIADADSVTIGQHVMHRIGNAANTAGIVAGWTADGAVVTGGILRSFGSLPLNLGTTTTPTAVTIYNTGLVSVGPSIAAAQLHVDQSSTTGAVPVLTVDQADVSEEFIRFIGTSTTDATQSLVDAANMTTPGALAGWLKIYVQDDAASGAITDAAYFVPFYAAPTS